MEGTKCEPNWRKKMGLALLSSSRSGPLGSPKRPLTTTRSESLERFPGKPVQLSGEMQGADETEAALKGNLTLPWPPQTVCSHG